MLTGQTFVDLLMNRQMAVMMTCLRILEDEPDCFSAVSDIAHARGVMTASEVRGGLIDRVRHVMLKQSGCHDVVGDMSRGRWRILPAPMPSWACCRGPLLSERGTAGAARRAGGGAPRGGGPACQAGGQRFRGGLPACHAGGQACPGGGPACQAARRPAARARDRSQRGLTIVPWPPARPDISRRRARPCSPSQPR